MIKVILRFGDFFSLYNFTFNVSSRELDWEDREAIVGIPPLYGERIEWGRGGYEFSKFSQKWEGT